MILKISQHLEKVSMSTFAIHSSHLLMILQITPPTSPDPCINIVWLILKFP